MSSDEDSLEKNKPEGTENAVDRGREKYVNAKKKKKRERSPSSSDLSSSLSESSRKKKKSKKSKKEKKKKKSKKSKKSKSKPSSSSKTVTTTKTVMSDALLAKLAEKNETLEERRARKERERNAQMAAKFGYSNDENPFNDPNLNESFTWGKKVQLNKGAAVPVAQGAEKKAYQEKLVGEIEKVRRRRIEREEEKEEMDRLREEESRLREMAHYDDWQRKEEEFHLAQQHQRTAIRLVEGREKPIDVLAKNVLLFGMSEEDKANKAAVKYKEKYNALQEMGNLEAELTPPHEFLHELKLEEVKMGTELTGLMKHFPPPPPLTQ